jgi:flagellar FliJ protein
MAKKFNFRLEPILKIRTEKVEETKKSLSTAIRSRYEKEDEISNLNNQKKQFLTEPQITSKASDMQATKDYVNNMDGQLQKKEDEKIKLLEIENHRRERLNEALIEEKVIVKLKEKKITEHQQQIDKEEKLFLDEVGTNQFITKLRQNKK